ncbi:MAG: bifunctional riboflavin kinase/FAD synthetase [Calditrichaeota bacterium]|nr:bifunctional riboflavin kinase/FAD synthetase [Calditrichota bacterium]
MKIYYDLDRIDKQDCVITIGTFDGVHRGHQTILDRLCQEAEKSHSCATVVTFEPHPQFVLKPERKPGLKLLTTLEEKISIFRHTAIQRLIVLPFTIELSQLSSQQFIENILLEKIGFRQIIVGYDHAFGRERRGNIETLSQLAESYHFSIIQMPPFEAENTIISSTKIRKLIAEGKLEQATRFLGRRYQLTGKVIQGEGRGRAFRIPTANLAPLSSEKLVPPAGIYAGFVRLREQIYKAVIYIGRKPTFSFSKDVIEAHLFDFHDALYGEKLTLEFVKKIRDDRKFDSVDKLINQIEKDKVNSLEILNKSY